MQQVKDFPKEDGVYILTRDVTNPQRDKRMTRDWKHDEVFKSGTKFRIYHETLDWCEPHIEVVRVSKEKSSGEYSSSYFDGDDIQVQVMLPYLEKSQLPSDQIEHELVKRYFDGLDRWSTIVLIRLVNKGELTIERVCQIIDEQRAEWDAAEDARLKELENESK
jgi:hypothetical protein